MSIRNAAKAIIVHEGKVLVNKNQDTIGYYGLNHGAIYYDLPGGGQNQYETLEEALVRECLEETGYTVIPQRLAGVFEEISGDEGFRKSCPDYAHKVHFVFIARLENENLTPLNDKDFDMLFAQWVQIEDIKNLPLYPLILKEHFEELLYTQSPLYLGVERVEEAEF